MKRCFSLIELMLVVIIIGVLATLVVPTLGGRAEKARIAAAKADIESGIPSALDLYEMDVGQYPERLEDLVDSPSGVETWEGPYLKKMPKDPWKRLYHYKSPGDHNKAYDLASSGNDGVLGSEDDITNWE